MIAQPPISNEKSNDPAPVSRRTILLAHGGGGQLTDELLAESILPQLKNPALDDLLDSAIFSAGSQKVAFTIDSYVVQPLKFPGGDIGRLAVSGTVNDLSVCGAKPIGLALSLILTEGLAQSELAEVIGSISRTADEAGVHVVTGDTKTVGCGHGDGVYITTAGIGVVYAQQRLHPTSVRPGDMILINGPIADHGLAVMLAREMPYVRSVLRSDVAPLNGLIETLLTKVPGVAFMRDPTRGGLAGVIADLAKRSGQRIILEERQIPVRPETRHAADLLGLDPLDVANEGKVLVVVRPDAAEQALEVMLSHHLGAGACIIGHVGPEADGLCELRTAMGGRRIIQKPYGEQLPRIC